MMDNNIQMETIFGDGSGGKTDCSVNFKRR
jgi:hypothetical protein